MKRSPFIPWFLPTWCGYLENNVNTYSEQAVASYPALNYYFFGVSLREKWEDLGSSLRSASFSDFELQFRPLCFEQIEVIMGLWNGNLRKGPIDIVIDW